MRDIAKFPKQRGFSLLILTIWLIVLGIAAAVVLALLPNKSDQTRIEKTITTIGDAQDAVLAFIVKNSRLPAPDTTSPPNGQENTGSTTGALPYRDMGLPTALLDQASIPVRYTPYRNTTASVDLTVASNLYIPAIPTDLSKLPGELTTIVDFLDSSDHIPSIDQCASESDTSSINLLDFCTALDNAEAATSTTSSVNVLPGPTNVAYVVLSGGLEDADGNGADQSLDGLNDDGNVSYEDPARGRGPGYDDIVRAVRFSTLQRELSSNALLDSVNMLAVQAQAAEGVMESTISSYNSAQTQVIMAEIQILLDVVAIAQTVQAGIGIAADIGESAGGCASIVLSPECCPALAGNIAAGVVYAVTAAVQVALLVVDAVALSDAKDNRNLFRDTIVPRANTDLCTAIGETTAADARGGLKPLVQP